jgi:hypothetical protein
VAAASGFVPDDLPGFQRHVRRLIAFSDAPPAPDEVEEYERLRAELVRGVAHAEKS